MDWSLIAPIAGALLGGSGLGALAQARAMNRKTRAEAHATDSQAGVSGVEAAERALAVLERSFQLRLEALEAQVQESTAREHACAKRLAELTDVVATHRQVLAVLVDSADQDGPSPDLKSALLAAKTILGSVP